ncbi:MAG: hypothetical protein ACRDP8_14650 [Actinopolymorphaceae bacterium]
MVRKEQDLNIFGGEVTVMDMDFQKLSSSPAPESTDDLPPVIWIGGGSGAGKSTVSRAISCRFDLAWYRIDARGYAHRDELIARGRLSAESTAETHDQRWLEPDPADLAARFVATSQQLFPLIVEDLRAMPRDVAVVVEGPQLLPPLVAPYLPDRDWGVWLLPTPDFRRSALAARFNAAQSTSDPARAQQNVLTRNAILDARTRSEAIGLGLSVIDVDGSRDLPTTVTHLIDLLTPALAKVPKARTGRQRSALRRFENDTMVTNVTAWLADMAPSAPPDPLLLPFACECERLGCTAESKRTPSEYEVLRAADLSIAVH